MTEHVKVYGVKPRIQYIADGILTTYDFPFATFKASDIEVYLQDIKILECLGHNRIQALL